MKSFDINLEKEDPKKENQNNKRNAKNIYDEKERQ